jgi:hypothetical protein
MTRRALCISPWEEEEEWLRRAMENSMEETGMKAEAAAAAMGGDNRDTMRNQSVAPPPPPPPLAAGATAAVEEHRRAMSEYCAAAVPELTWRRCRHAIVWNCSSCKHTWETRIAAWNRGEVPAEVGRCRLTPSRHRDDPELTPS